MEYPLPSLALLGAALAAAAYCDVAVRRVPNAISVTVAIAGLAAQGYARGFAGLGSGLLAAAIVMALLWFAWTRGRVGGGDLKLATAAAVWVGTGELAAYLLSGAVAGGVLAVICYAASAPEARLRMRANLSAAGLGAPLPQIKGSQGRVSVPYAVAVAVGVAVAWAWSWGG